MPKKYFSCDSKTMSNVVFTERIPDILTKIVDHLNKRAAFLEYKQEQEMKEDVMATMRRVVELRSSVMKGKPFETLTDGQEDNETWNTDIVNIATSEEGQEKCWMNCPMLFSEVYYYRKLQEIFKQSEFHQNFDYFSEMKMKATFSAEPFMKIAAKYVKSIFDDFHPTKEHLRTLILFSTFSNQIDLSLMHGNDKIDIESENFDITEFVKYIITDDLDKICDYIASYDDKVRKPYHFVLDNAGLEFFCDICLAIYLLRTTTATNVTFHIKKFPTFVSDVTYQDFEYMDSFLSKSKDPNMKFVNNVFMTYVKTSVITFESDFSWNFHHQYSDLLEVWPNFSRIVNTFDDAALVIFKGDLNFRRLCGELQWDVETPMREAVKNLSRLSLLILRTIKSVSYCQLKPEIVEKLKETKDDWYMLGDQAQIIFIDKKQ